MSVTARFLCWFARAAHWLARLSSAAVLGLAGWFLIGEGPPDLDFMSGQERAQLVLFGVVLLGLVVGWARELTGGVMVVLGMTAFTLIELIGDGRPPGGAVPLLWIPGALFLLSAALHRGPVHAPR